jgi:hypothetical protein
MPHCGMVLISTFALNVLADPHSSSYGLVHRAIPNQLLFRNSIYNIDEVDLDGYVLMISSYGKKV